MRRLERSNDTRYSYLQLFLIAAAVVLVPVAIFMLVTWYQSCAAPLDLEFSGNVITVRYSGNL